MDSTERPCIKICRYEDDTGWCLGCGLTKQEKKAWKRVPNYRPAIRDALPARMAALDLEGHATGVEAGGKKHRA